MKTCGPSYRWICTCVLWLAAALLCVPSAHGEPPDEILEMANNGRVREATSLAWQELQAARASFGGDSIEAARAVELLFKVLPSVQDSPTDSLGAWLLQAQRTREKLFGPLSPRLLPAIWQRSRYLDSTREYKEASILIETAKTILGQGNEVSGGERAETMYAIGDLAYAQRDVTTATSWFEKGLAEALAAEVPAGKLVARAKIRLAYVQSRSGEIEAALENVNDALRIFEENYEPGSNLIASALNSRGTLYRRMGRLTEAIADNERATNIFKRSLGDKHGNVAGMLNNLGNLLRTIGDQGRAVAAFRESIRIREKMYGPKHPLLAQSQMNMGTALRDMARYEEAIEAFETALSIQRTSLGAQDGRLALTLSNLGASYNMAARYDDAREVLEESLIILEANHGPDSFAAATPMVSMSVCERFKGNLDRALELAEKSLQLQIDALGQYNPELSIPYGMVAVSHYSLGNYEKAIEFALLAERVSRLELQLTAGGFSETTAAAAAMHRHTATPTLFRAAQHLDASQGALLESIVGEAFRSRAVVLDRTMSRRRQLLSREDDATRTAMAALSETQNAVLAFFAQKRTAKNAQEHEHQYKKLRDELEAAEAAFARIDYAAAEVQRELNLADLRAAMPEKSVVVSYWYVQPARTFEDHTGSYFAIVTGHTQVEIVDLGNAQTIDTALALWRESIQTVPASGEATLALERGQRMRELVWDPIANLVAQVDMVLVVPDDRLHFLPFGALPNRDNTYLVEKGPLLHLLSSERDLLLPRDPHPKATGLLVLGGADFDATNGSELQPQETVPAYLRGISDCESFQDVNFKPLPASGEEAQSIARLWGDSLDSKALLLSKGEASERAVREQATQYATLHFATHGFFLGGECAKEEPQLRGVGGLAPSWSSADAVGETFRLSGLALAGANHRDGYGANDGILTAEEIACLDLRGVEWAVLSACDTGLGKLVQAEGVLGLRRSFRIAGAATVITSLWAVEDNATRDWMNELYTARLRDGLDTANSVREASRRVLAQRRASGQSTHPFYWASFAGSGRWE